MDSSKNVFGLVEVNSMRSMEEARSAAMDLAVNTFGQVCPVIIYTQGRRLSASASIPMGLAITVLSSDPVSQQASLGEVQNSYNRPINKDHVKSVADYLVQSIENEDKYILPSLTVTATKKQKIFTTDLQNKESFTQLGYLILPREDGSLIVTDGQHRLEGIKLAFSQLEGSDVANFQKDSISIMFSFEDDLAQVHQDFADCSKTKALPKSMIAVYDRRIPINGITLDLINACPLFNDGRTDSTSVSLGKKSTSLVLTSSIRNIMKSLFTGNHSMADNALDNYANKNLSDKEAYLYHLDLVTKVINLMTLYNPVLNEISILERGPKRQKIANYREHYLLATPTGLSLACKVIHKYMLSNPEAKLEPFIEKLMTEINWSKESEIWRGNIINQRNGKYAMSSTNKVFEIAINNIAESLSMNLDGQDTLDFMS